ncbi:MAG: hypothetical protein ACFFDY_09020 [Candidatus Thorarchaeota archaeon]
MKHTSKRSIICPLCKKQIIVGVENCILENKRNDIHLPHLHLHGDPLHAIICYLNSKLDIRNIGVIKSIEISRDSETFTQLMKKWTNPY